MIFFSYKLKLIRYVSRSAKNIGIVEEASRTVHIFSSENIYKNTQIRGLCNYYNTYNTGILCREFNRIHLRCLKTNWSCLWIIAGKSLKRMKLEKAILKRQEKVL